MTLGYESRSWCDGLGSVKQGTPCSLNSRAAALHGLLSEIIFLSSLAAVSDAIKLQREWSFARTSSLLTMLYRKVGLLPGPSGERSVSWCSPDF